MVLVANESTVLKLIFFGFKDVSCVADNYNSFYVVVTVILFYRLIRQQVGVFGRFLNLKQALRYFAVPFRDVHAVLRVNLKKVS